MYTISIPRKKKKKEEEEKKKKQHENEEEEEKEEEAEERRTEEMTKTPNPPPYTQSPSPRRTGGGEGGRRGGGRREKDEGDEEEETPTTPPPPHPILIRERQDTGICLMNSGQLGSSLQIFLPYGRMTAVLEQRAGVSIPVIDRQEEGDQAERKARSDSGQAHFLVVREAREAIF